MTVRVSEICSERDRTRYGLFNTLPTAAVWLITLIFYIEIFHNFVPWGVFLVWSIGCVIALAIVRIYNNSKLHIDKKGITLDRSQTKLNWNLIDDIRIYKININSFRPYFILVINYSNINMKITVDDYLITFAEEKLKLIRTEITRHTYAKFDLNVKKGGVEMIPPN